jgi:transcriptional regulator with XRE-family HTH domain
MGTTLLAPPLTPEGVKFLRKLAGLTLQEVSEKTGIAKAQVCRYEQRQRPLREEQLIKIDNAIREALAAREESIAKVRAADVTHAAMSVAS